MLERLVIAVGSPASSRKPTARPSPLSDSELAVLSTEFPAVTIVLARDPPEAPMPVTIDAAGWAAPSFDLASLDRRVADAVGGGASSLRVAGLCANVGGTCLEILTRYQRFIERRNHASDGPVFDRILARHRMLFDVNKPLIRADYDHALDTWQWILRLEPSASLPLQAAALFHDIERTESEADVRVEHLAPGYQECKDAHARRGAGISRLALRDTGLNDDVRGRVATLIESHEHPRPDAEIILLNEADALSFFSLNSSGFIDEYGVDPARRKIAFTMNRLRPETRARLRRIRFRPDVQALLTEEAGPIDWTPRSFRPAL